MAETMTYDPGTDTVTTENSLTSEEQESLKVGEELESQQDQLLAGKYANAQELEKAYIELQKKLGDSDNETTDEVEKAEAEKDTEESPDLSEGAQLIADASNEYYSNEGKLSQETLDQFTKMSSQDLVNAYIEMSQKYPQDSSYEAPDLTDSEINVIKNSAGGEKAYSDMVSWAESNLPKEQLDAFDNIVNTGTLQAIQLAVNGLKSEYENANGYEGRMLTGKSPQTSGDVFRSQQELVAAMADRRYDNDPAYRMDVMEKLDRSDIEF